MLVWVTDRRVGVDLEAAAKRPCPRCEAPAGKVCAGGAAGRVEETKAHPAFKWADMCVERLEVPLALL